FCLRSRSTGTRSASRIALRSGEPFSGVWTACPMAATTVNPIIREVMANVLSILVHLSIFVYAELTPHSISSCRSLFEFVEGHDAAFAHGWVFFELADADRIVPAAFTFRTVRSLDLDICRVALVNLDLRNDEDVSKL